MCVDLVRLLPVLLSTTESESLVVEPEVAAVAPANWAFICPSLSMCYLKLMIERPRQHLI